MYHSPLSDFLIAATIDAEYRETALKWEEERRLDDRLAKITAEIEKPAEEMQTLLTALIVAGLSPMERERIEQRLGSHQNAVVEALQDNREDLDRIDTHIDDLLGKAHVLDDGTRVFETRDGTQVYDEHGRAVSASTITPDEIDDARPKWETYDAAVNKRIELQEVQTELLQYQDRLDAAQSAVDNGTFTRDEYNELNDLMMDTPTAVRSRLPTSDPAYQPATRPTPLGNELDLSDLDVTGPKTGRFGFN